MTVSTPADRVAVEMSLEELGLVWEAVSRELQRAPAHDPRRAPLAALMVRVRAFCPHTR